MKFATRSPEERARIDALRQAHYAKQEAEKARQSGAHAPDDTPAKPKGKAKPKAAE